MFERNPGGQLLALVFSHGDFVRRALPNTNGPTGSTGSTGPTDPYGPYGPCGPYGLYGP